MDFKPTIQICNHVFPWKQKERRARMELSESRPRDGQAYMDMYNRRGSDVDYRIGFFQARIPYVEKSIQELVSFAKAIPGFRSIPMADQMTLIKCRSSPDHMYGNEYNS